METLLLTIGFIGIIFLIMTPWVKTGTVVAIGSLVGYFYCAGVDSWIPIILFVMGLVLMVLEVFIPDPSRFENSRLLLEFHGQTYLRGL